VLGAYTLTPLVRSTLNHGRGDADNIQIRIDTRISTASARIVVRHPNMFLGYYKNTGSLRGRHGDG